MSVTPNLRQLVLERYFEKASPRSCFYSVLNIIFVLLRRI
jgi:hypothetical protein